MTEEQNKLLNEVFRCAVAISYADSDEDNKTSCASFNMKAFHQHWDKRTVDEVKYQVQLYTRTWIVYPLERAFGLKTEDVSDEMMLSWHRKQIGMLTAKIKNKK